MLSFEDTVCHRTVPGHSKIPRAPCRNSENVFLSHSGLPEKQEGEESTIKFTFHKYQIEQLIQTGTNINCLEFLSQVTSLMKFFRFYMSSNLKDKIHTQGL